MGAMEAKYPNGLEAAMRHVGMSGSELARLLQTSRQNVSRWMKGERELLPAVAAQIAPHLKTTPSALLLLNAVDSFCVPLGGRIVGGGNINIDNQENNNCVHYEVELKLTVPDVVEAYQVVGESMMPVYRPDTVILCKAQTSEIEVNLGKELAVGTADGGRMLKTIHRGSRPGLYDLSSFNAATLRDVSVLWVERIAAIIPADEWKILEKKSVAHRAVRSENTSLL